MAGGLRDESILSRARREEGAELETVCVDSEAGRWFCSTGGEAAASSKAG
jgi:hypothetical protein